MDITKGSLDSISRPASSERSRPSSRVSSVSLLERRVNHATPGSFVVLSPDITETQEQMGTAENVCFSKSSEDLLHSLLDFEPSEATTAQAEDIVESTLPDNPSPDTEPDEESEDPEVQKAIHKMRKLDKILALRISNEIEIKKQGKELHQKLWEELQELKPQEALECSDEAANTRLFLALSSSTFGSNEEADYHTVFKTQIPVDQCDYQASNRMDSETDHGATADSPKVAREERMADLSEGSQCGLDRGKKKQDFVKKNIELVRDARSQVLMTDAEKARLEELLQDLDSGDREDQEDPNLLAVLTSSGEGYTPEPAELDQLLHIDSRLQLLLPMEDFLCLRSKYPPQGLPEGPRAGWDGEGDRLPGEKVLQDMRVTREQEARLREIEQQLDRDQSGTCGRPILSEGQLSSLLEDCVEALSRMPSVLSGSWGCSPGASLDYPSSPYSLLDSGTLRLSDSVLSELLRSARGLETPPLGNDTPPLGKGTPLLRNYTSPLGKGMPLLGKGTPPLGKGMQPPGNGTPPPGNGTPPLGNGTPPLGDYTPPSGNYTPLPGNYTPPLGNHTPPPGNYTPPPGNGTPPPGNGTPPPGNYTPPLGNYTPPLGNGRPCG